MVIFTLFTLAGIVLFITKHRGWGLFCFGIAFVSLLAQI